VYLRDQRHPFSHCYYIASLILIYPCSLTFQNFSFTGGYYVLVYFDEWEPSAFPHSLDCWCTIFALNGVASSFAFWHARTDMKEFLYAVEWPFVSTMPHLEKHAYSSRTRRKFDQKILPSKDCGGESTYLICQLSGRCGKHVILKFHNLGLISCRSWIFGVTGLIILPICEWLFSVSRPDSPPPQSTDPTSFSLLSTDGSCISVWRSTLRTPFTPWTRWMMTFVTCGILGSAERTE